MLRINYRFSETCTPVKDSCESWGDYFLSFSRNAFGYQRIEESNERFQVEKISHVASKIFVFLLVLPLTATISLIGLACIACSNTHSEKYRKLLQQNQMPANRPLGGPLIEAIGAIGANNLVKELKPPAKILQIQPPQPDSPIVQVDAKRKMEREFPLEPIDPALEPELAFDQGGPRTVAMRSLFEQFSVFKNKLLEIQGKKFTPLTTLTRDISSKPVASCGSTIKREVILLDPANSPILKDHYKTLLSEIQEKLKERNEQPQQQEEFIIKHVLAYVREVMFCSKAEDKEKATEAFIEQGEWKEFIDHQGHKIPLIKIDQFIKAGIGVCRHHGLVTSYLLDRLIKADMLQGTVQHMRDNLGSGAHVWVTFTSAYGKRWHIDTLWNNMVDFSSPQGMASLEQIYNCPTVALNEFYRSQEIYEKMVSAEARAKIVEHHLDSILDKNQASGIYIRRSSVSDNYVIEYPALTSKSKTGLRFRVTKEGLIQFQLGDPVAYPLFIKHSQKLMKQCFEDSLHITTFSVEAVEKHLLSKKEEGAFAIRLSTTLPGFYTLDYYSNHALHSIKFRLTSRGTIAVHKSLLESVEYPNLDAIKKALKLGKQLVQRKK